MPIDLTHYTGPVQIKHGGSQYVDPKTNIKQRSLSEELAKALLGSTSVKDKLQQRNDFVDRTYDAFMKYMEKDSVMKASEFSKYEILYSRELKDKFNAGLMSMDEQLQIRELSNEFISKINPQRPIHIVDDVTGEEVMPPLPPLYMKLMTLSHGGEEAVNYFHNACVNDDQVPGGMGEQQRAKATANLRILLAKSQTTEDIYKNINNFDHIANEFHKKVLGKAVWQDPEEQGNNNTNNTNTPNNSKQQEQIPGPDDDMFDYDPM